MAMCKEFLHEVYQQFLHEMKHSPKLVVFFDLAMGLLFVWAFLTIPYLLYGDVKQIMRAKQAFAISLADLSQDSKQIAPPLLPDNKWGADAAIISSIAEVEDTRRAVGCLFVPGLESNVIQPVLFHMAPTSDQIDRISVVGDLIYGEDKYRLDAKCDSFQSIDFD